MNLKMHSKRIEIILIAEAHRLLKQGYYRQAYETGTLFKSVGAESKVTRTRIDIDFGTQEIGRAHV